VNRIFALSLAAMALGLGLLLEDLQSGVSEDELGERPDLERVSRAGCR